MAIPFSVLAVLNNVFSENIENSKLETSYHLPPSFCKNNFLTTKYEEHDLRKKV